MPPFGFSSDVPPDPAYLRFLKGLESVTADPAGKSAWRWHAGEGKWYTYDPAQWGMEDFGAPDTPPESVIRQDWGFPQSKWKVESLWAPALFERLKQAGASLAGAHPAAKNLVWSPWGGGDWRAAFKRASPPPPPPPPNGKKKPSPACMKRIEDVQEYERSGAITHDQAQRLIEKIVAECT